MEAIFSCNNSRPQIELKKEGTKKAVAKQDSTDTENFLVLIKLCCDERFTFYLCTFNVRRFFLRWPFTSSGMMSIQLMYVVRTSVHGPERRYVIDCEMKFNSLHNSRIFFVCSIMVSPLCKCAVFVCLFCSVQN